MVSISAGGHLEYRYAGCGENLLIGNPLFETPQLRLPPSAESPTGSTTYLVPTDALAEVGRATLILHSPLACLFTSDSATGECFERDRNTPWWRHEAVVTTQIQPDTSRPRTLIGGH